MDHRTIALAAVAALTISAAPPRATEPAIGAVATNFTARDTDGNIVELKRFRGRTVVLEWNNPGCPYVQKHYRSGNMQRTQAAAIADGAVWLTINSGAPGKQGHMSGPEAAKFVAEAKAKPTECLLDPTGAVGKGYGARTTPHLFIVDRAGKLVFKGGIDDRPTADAADIAGARNHVLAALAEMKAGKRVSVPETRPYGCTVKYAD